MKITLTIVGVLLVLFGAIWVLQGFNMFPGQSFMNGQRRRISFVSYARPSRSSS